MNFRIRVLRAGEIEEALDFIMRIFPEAEDTISDDDMFFIAEFAGKVIGFAHVSEEEDGVILQGIGVEESVRGHGIGSALIEKIFEVFGRTDKTIFLKTQMSNPALELYHNYGFRVKHFGNVHILERKRET